MNSKYIIIGLAVVGVAGIAWYTWRAGSSAMPQAQNAPMTLSLAQDVSPIALSASEQRALNNAGVPSVSTGADPATTALQAVHASDRLSDIQADLSATNLLGLDAEAAQITKDVAF